MVKSWSLPIAGMCVAKAFVSSQSIPYCCEKAQATNRASSTLGAIILTLTHRIPSELLSEACLGESSTRMGDPLGNPRGGHLEAGFIFLGWGSHA
ncbi:hypothetical protein LguiB_013047 [Lonicera macranthoides]